jgi:hypothetical protein
VKKTATQQHPGEQQTLFGTKKALMPEGNGCLIVSVGKRRDGGTRYWCLKHRSDATAKYGKPADACRTAHVPPIPEKDILTLDFAQYPGGVALWGAVPPVYDTTTQGLDRGIHVHSRVTPESEKKLDNTFRAVRMVGKQLPEGGLYVDELDAIYYMATTIFGYTMKQVLCTSCGYAHLDRDWFSVHPHVRHLCAGCGKHFRDTGVGIGNPICGIRDACGIQTRTPKASKKVLDIRQRNYPGGIQIWGSNPAFIWTGENTEAEGIHVHAFKKDVASHHPDVDETYGKVTIDGTTLDPMMVRLYMAQAVIGYRRWDAPSREDYLRIIRLRWELRLENWVFSIARKRPTKTLWSLFAIECQVGKLGFRRNRLMPKSPSWRQHLSHQQSGLT